MGYVVELAGNGQEAVELIRREPGRYALIFMDCQMPVMDGFSATHEIRALQAVSGSRVPIVAMTASAMESHERRCLDAGMDGFISKPIDLQRIRESLARFLPAAESAQDVRPA